MTPENQHTSKLGFRADASAAYTHALKWVVTGDKRHSGKAIEIYNAWSKVTCRPHKPAGFELAFNHYRYRLEGKYKLPETGKVMSRFGPVDATNSKSLPWPTLTRSRLSDSTDQRIDHEQDVNPR